MAALIARYPMVGMAIAVAIAPAMIIYNLSFYIISVIKQKWVIPRLLFPPYRRADFQIVNKTRFIRNERYLFYSL